MTLLEVSEATQIIHDAAGDDANIIFGAVLDETMDDEVMVTVIATGFNNKPTFTGLSYPGEEKSNIPYAPAEEVLGTKRPPRVERMTAPMTMDEYEERKRILQNEGREEAHIPEPEVTLPRVERMNTRGTLTEREPAAPGNAFERLSSGAFRAASSVRLTPSNETNHVSPFESRIVKPGANPDRFGAMSVNGSGAGPVPARGPRAASSGDTGRERIRLVNQLESGTSSIVLMF